MSHRTLLASLLLATACAGGSVRGPPALTGERVTGFSEATLGGAGHKLYLRNNTSSPIRINSFTIFECENI